MNSVTVIGHFGFGLQYYDGQTIKTKIVTEELCRQFGENEIKKIDTHGGVKSLLKAPFQVLKAFNTSRNVIILPAHNGLRVYAPLLSVFKFFFKYRKIHYVVIGGWLPEFLKSKKSLTKCLKHFEGIYVETNTMKEALVEQGFENVFVMPNCKKLHILNESELVYQTTEPYKLCTFSRVMKEKGIEVAVIAVKAVNEQFGRVVYTLDIYGQIDSDQNEWFDELKKSFPPYIKYGGLVPFDKSVEVLKYYFALLFPTCYEGEGFAGTLIDAYSAGVPVIASEWRYNSELVNKKTGYVYQVGDNGALLDILMNAEKNPNILLSKKQGCLEEAEKYKVENVIRNLVSAISDLDKTKKF